MAKEGGEQSPAWAPRGSGPVGGVTRIPQPWPVSHRTYCVHPVGYLQPCPAGWGLEVCGVCPVRWNRIPALRSPDRALSAPGLARQEQVDRQGSLAALPPGSEGLIHLFMSCGPTPR